MEMTTSSKLQQLIGSVPATEAEGTSVPMITRLTSEPSFAAAVQNARLPAWDPHEVWLNRVRRPRENRSAG
jgi:hypothetical protein